MLSSIFAPVVSFFHALNTLVVLAFLGAALGLGCALVGRLNYIAAAAAGAVMLIGAHFSGVLGTLASENAKQQIADLQVKNDKLQFDLTALNKVRVFETKQAAEMTEKTKMLEKGFQAALSVIDKHMNDKECGISTEELDAIRKIK